MELPITALFVGIFALFLVLVRLRPGTLPEAMRVNFISAVLPISTLLFLLMAILELQGLLWWVVTLLGILTTLGYLPQTARLASAATAWALLAGGAICVYVWVIEVLL